MSFKFIAPIATLLAGFLLPYADTRADDIFDVEHARAAERSGWPLSDNNMDYLERWGGVTTPSVMRPFELKEDPKSRSLQRKKGSTLKRKQSAD